jgi:hypothetical protein
VAAELQLALAYELTAQNAPRFAADIVSQAGAQGVSLDYSLATVDYLDSVLASLRAAGVTVEQVPEVLFGLGCVLGEILIEATDASWVSADFAVPIGVKASDGHLEDPVGQTFAALLTGTRVASYVASVLEKAAGLATPQ